MLTKPFWHLSEEALYQQFKSEKGGLDALEAKRRLKKHGPNCLKPPQRGKGLWLLVTQFTTPLILLLLGAAFLSFYLGGRIDAMIIFAIVFFSGILSFFQERGALNALEKLLQLVENKASVFRDGNVKEISMQGVVPGDVISLSAGDLIPADAIVLESNHFFVDEATLTGESFPIEKVPGEIPINTPPLKRSNALFFGTMVSSGSAVAIVVATGKETVYSHIAERVRFRPPETAFEIGVKNLSYMLLKVTFILFIIGFAGNIYLKRPVIEALLFSLALAVGVTPQLLPAVISVNLAHGARRMARKSVIIKRLASIENFGQMNVLCTDKTGTLTLGKMDLDQAVDIEGNPSAKVLQYALLNSTFQMGYANPIDQAILAKKEGSFSKWKKIGEIPYDFIRKRISVFLSFEKKEILITKGAVPQVLSICNHIETAEGKIATIKSFKKPLEDYLDQKSGEGFRTIAVAYGETKEEKGLTFLGFLHFLDPVKPSAKRAIKALKDKKVELKIITGDHEAVARHVASFLDLDHISILTGKELTKVSDRALLKLVSEKNIFAEIEPNQKERIILTLRKAGYVVGFLGDGVNDVSAIHSADIGISVEGGSDAAKEAADIVLLKKDLGVLENGIIEGRRTFSNTLKYVYMAISANFGNMFSMTGASLLLPFLPLLPKQVLLTNFMSDFPEMALATDNVDDEAVIEPAKWDLKAIRHFMILFGLLSSIADYMTFGALYYLGLGEGLFQTGWFVESVVSATLVVLVIRTRGSIFRSVPGKLLLVAVVAIVALTLALPFIPIARELFSFVKLPSLLYVLIGGIVVFYLVIVEIAKRWFFKKLYS